jgi:predicted Fe-S protein YdhL (DUF1289 family)
MRQAHRHREQALLLQVCIQELLMSSTKDPCISLCKFTDDICVGCGRSKREIKAWKKLDKTDKRTVLAEAALRLIKLGATGRRKAK